MLKKYLFSLVLCGVLGTLSIAQTESKMQISEPLSGVEAKKALQNFPKESKSALKVKQGAKGGQFPYENDVVPPFDSATDSLVALKDANGNTILFVTYTTKTPIAEVGVLTPNPSRLYSPNDFAVWKWDSKKQELYAEYVNAGTYYNGGRNPTDKHPEWGMPYSNSFGMWIKLGGYPPKPIPLFNRNEEILQTDPGWEYQYFNFQLLESGQLSVTTKLTDYSTERIITTKPIPLNKWVYVQAIQEVRNYKLGWKAEDGSDEELVKKEFNADTVEFNRETSYIRKFDTAELINFLKTSNYRLYVNVKELFYNPIVGMFELMNNYNAKEKLIFSTGSQITYDINTLIQESYIVLTGGTSSILNINDIDIYYDPQTLDILLIDWRVNRRGAN
ncbi:hypothetical protein LS70_001255 [Helicobacter sp. MIT 11-5569]|uniref:hypothetical protein n=1 Tax=Helicobacter sp. MIT 11-5569 TaxID=1548151 RepID=UPI00051FA612|nr:hypothetical protein [Helicobacter sp. MIT 11-5569]TLD85204.1 hypothetical protein LS70_001255 [Helicobacter sp. MIT 11-5569]